MPRMKREGARTKPEFREPDVLYKLWVYTPSGRMMRQYRTPNMMERYKRYYKEKGWKIRKA